MSRIGKQPINIPAGVDVKIEGNEVVVSKGGTTLNYTFSPRMEVVREENHILVKRGSDSREDRSLHGLTRSLISNMVVGVSEGFAKNLEIQGVGYRVRLEDGTLVLNLGYSNPVEFPQPEGITFEVPSATRIIVKGADRQLVGETAAKIRSIRPPDSYHGKGIRYQGEYVRIKEGKTGARL
ncbi:MAG: 50S ribosomal protein L6 [Clostridiaceae bacterium]|nr:50S ribosomal protein L6 [Clostridiaceae bacterium]